MSAIPPEMAATLTLAFLMLRVFWTDRVTWLGPEIDTPVTLITPLLPRVILYRLGSSKVLRSRSLIGPSKLTRIFPFLSCNWTPETRGALVLMVSDPTSRVAAGVPSGLVGSVVVTVKR